MDEKIEQFISQMTLEEKVSLLSGADQWYSKGIPRLGIPAFKMTDGPHGARGEAENSGPTSAAFPIGTAMAATWNTDLIEQVGAALGDETKAKGSQVLLGPTVNIHRNPTAGRNFECFSEDPYLTAQIAIAYIRGLQGKGVAACIKHFVCNESEVERTTMSSEVGERALREIYLRPFELAIQQAKPWSLMSSYNRVNGVPASENKRTLIEILKDEWGFDGVVISDWYGTYSPNIAAGGLDLEMPGPARWTGGNVIDALVNGEITEAVIDDKIRRILRLIDRTVGFSGSEPQDEQANDLPKHRSLIRKAGTEAIVLLKNEADALPLDLRSIRKMAVIGENARWTPTMGGGSSRVSPHYVINALDAIRERAGADVEVGYQIGCTVMRAFPLFDAGWVKTGPDGERGFKQETFANRALEGQPIETKTTDRTELVWFGDDQIFAELANFSIRLSGIWTPTESGSYQLSLSAMGKFRLLVDGEVVIDRWDNLPDGEAPFARNSAVESVELQTGKTYDIAIEYAVIPGADWRNMRLGCLPPMPEEPVKAAVELAREADVAVVFAGLNGEWDSEGGDRPHLDLPGDQVKLIEAVAAANPNTIVVLNTGSPVRMPWLGKVRSVLETWYLGQEAGNAIADVLFGIADPGGRLPTTFPQRLQDTPSYLNYPGENGKVLYGEDIFVGYRYYDKKDVAPLFPFGHGLSYTNCAYENLQLSEVKIEPGGSLQLSVEVENTGNRRGKEVVQVYVRDVQSKLARPEKELKAFASVEIEPGETKTVNLTLGPDALAFYDPGVNRWVVEPGEFQVLVGHSAGDIRLKAEFTVTEDSTPLCKEARLHVGLALNTLLNDPAGKSILARYLGQHIQNPHLLRIGEISLEEIAGFSQGMLPNYVLRVINEELARV